MTPPRLKMECWNGSFIVEKTDQHQIPKQLTNKEKHLYSLSHQTQHIYFAKQHTKVTFDFEHNYNSLSTSI